MFRTLTLLFAFTTLANLPAVAEELRGKIVVDLSKPGPAFPPTMHGIFFEDINYAADGGLYAELIQNRSFEHGERMYAWTPIAPSDVAELTIADEAPLNGNNQHYLRITVRDAGAGVANRG